MSQPITGTEFAGRSTDPRFYSGLSLLPNPDPILRKAGKSEEVFEAIQADAHVIGELRLIRADLSRFKHRLVAGGDGKSRRSKRALELCQAFLERAPAPLTKWTDMHWHVGQAPFRGQSLTEIVWERTGDLLMPAKLLDRPNRRFAYDPDGALRVLTRDQPLYGVPAEEAYFLLNRHMPSYDNPYGVALFSSCFWPHLFKTAGFRFTVKFCERVGIPFPLGTYPAGTPEPDIAKLEEALKSLLEAGYAAYQEGGAITLLESKIAGGSGKLVQQQLVELCNTEMSKALSSQTLSTDQPNSGSRAAAETGRGRSADVNEGDREAIAYTYDHLWRLITRFNFGEDAIGDAPTSEFLSEEAASKDRAEIYKTFAELGGNPSRKAMATDLGIELANPDDPEDQLAPPVAAPAPGEPLNPAAIAGQAAAEFARRTTGEFPDQEALDAVDLGDELQRMAEGLTKPLLERVKNGVPPEELLADLANLYPQLDDEALQAMLARAIFIGEVFGRLSAKAEADA